MHMSYPVIENKSMTKPFRRPVSFFIAKETADGTLRQTYLDGINLEWARPYISRLLYLNKNTTSLQKGAMGNAMETVPTLRTIFGCRGIPSLVRVRPIAFQMFNAENDFKSVLIDHEGKHAKDNYDHPEWVNILESMQKTWKEDDVFFERRKVVREKRAFKSQLREHSKNNRHITAHYEEYIRRTIVTLIERRNALRFVEVG